MSLRRSALRGQNIYMAEPHMQFERSITPENSLLTQSICRYCHRIVAAATRRKLLTKVEQSHVCPEKPTAATRFKQNRVRPV
jgi:hypothetical protein